MAIYIPTFYRLMDGVDWLRRKPKPAVEVTEGWDGNIISSDNVFYSPQLRRVFRNRANVSRFLTNQTMNSGQRRIIDYYVVPRHWVARLKASGLLDDGPLENRLEELDDINF